MATNVTRTALLGLMILVASQPVLATHAIQIAPPKSQGAGLQVAPDVAGDLTSKVIDRSSIPQIPGKVSGKIPGYYIVVFKDQADPVVESESIAAQNGLQVGFVYSHALHGFSAHIPANALEKIRNDPRVKFVEEDQVVQAFDLPGLEFPAPDQTIPTGIDRIDADKGGSFVLNHDVDADIAIIDTGIDRYNPDLKVVRGATCFGAGLPWGLDDNGHGTHVSGTAAAKNDPYGVVGVAPGARLWAVKVLNFAGSGSMSCVVSGVDYVTAHASEIDVANMSLGCQCHSDALKEAIQRSTEAGVTYVVAAGNSASDASTFEPASYSLDNDGVITVSAVADSDGKCGGVGDDTSYGADDTFASFSNFGSPVTIAAPGVDIESTYLFRTYATLSGTSMATPHVTGAAALLHDSMFGLTPSDVRSTLVQSSVQQDSQCDGDGNGGFSGDPDDTHEPMLYIPNLG